MNSIPDWRIRSLVEAALAEDIGAEDITTGSIFPGPFEAEGRIIAKEEIVLAGVDIAKEVFLAIDKTSSFGTALNDGRRVKPGEIVLSISGDGRALLKGERVALNFLQRLSGIATLTSRYIEKIGGLGVKILDTRKTTPGLRDLEKWAVRIGGGYNHRFSLSTAILIKDNHIRLAGGISEAIKRVRSRVIQHLKIEVEAGNLGEVEEALRAGADIIMLDNMQLKAIREAVKIIDHRVPIEVSGGVDISSIREIAETGVDYISVGAITHSAGAVDIHMDIIPVGGRN